MVKGDEEQTELTRVQREVQEALIEVTHLDQTPPTPTRANEFMKRDVRGTLKELKRLGYVAQAYPYAPYVPVKTPDGTPLRLQLIEVPEDSEAEMCTFVAA